MSTQPPGFTPTPPQPAASSVPSSYGTPDEVRVFSHSSLFYWWPVWAVGFIMGLYTLWVDGSLMVTVPKGSQAVKFKEVTYVRDGKEVKLGEKDLDAEGVIGPKLDKTKHTQLPRARKDRDNANADPEQPRIHMAQSKNLGVIFCTVLLLVIVITNVPLRGMWSVVVIISIALVAVIVAYAGFWEWIVDTLWLLDIRINAGGYFFISGVLCGIWALATFLFDRQTYIIFTPNNFKVCQSIGDAEIAYDNIGMTLEKQRGDIFRHYILGLGSGDLVVKTAGAQAHHFDLPNVLFIHRKVHLIEALREKRGATVAKVT